MSLPVLICATVLASIALLGLIILSALGADTTALRAVLTTVANLAAAAAGVGAYAANRTVEKDTARSEE